MSRCANDCPLRVHCGQAAEHVVADDGRDRDTGDAELPRGLDRGVRGRGGVDAARVRDDLRAAVGDERQRPREIRGQVARVAAGLVARSVLLQDREGQFRERFETEVVDAFGEQGVDRGRRVAVEPLAARDASGMAGTSGMDGRSPIGPGPRDFQLRGDAQQEIFAAVRGLQLDADRQAGGVPRQRQRDRGLARSCSRSVCRARSPRRG